MRLTCLLVLCLAASGCKARSAPDSATLDAESHDPYGDLELEAERIAEEFDLLESWLVTDWQGTGFPVEGLALQQGQQQPPPLTLARVRGKIDSVDSHLRFILAELSNPESEYHKALAKKNLAVDVELEAKLIDRCKSAQAYVQKARGPLAKTEVLAKAAGKDLEDLPAILTSKLRTAFVLIDAWDMQLAAIELVIKGKEAIASSSKQLEAFFGSLGK